MFAVPLQDEIPIMGFVIELHIFLFTITMKMMLILCPLAGEISSILRLNINYRKRRSAQRSSAKSHLLSFAPRTTGQIALNDTSVYIALEARAEDSDPSPLGGGGGGGWGSSPPPYCWIHIAHFPFTSILNNGPFLFKVLERQLPRFAIVYKPTSRFSRISQGKW